MDKTPTEIKKKLPEGMSEPDLLVWENPLRNLPQDKIDKFKEEFLKKNKEDYELSLKETQIILEKFNILDVLCHFSFYFLSSPPGVNMEMEGIEILQFHVELLQALGLHLSPRSAELKPFLGKDAEEIKELIIKMSNSFIYKRLFDFEDDESKINAFGILENFRIQNMTIRNWGYKEQVINVMKELFTPMDNIILEELDLSLINVLEMVILLIEKFEDKLNKKIKIMAEIRNAPDKSDMIKKITNHYPFFSKEDLFKIENEFENDELFAHYLNFILCDQLIKDIYTFSLEDCINLYPGNIGEKSLQDILDKWSIELGGLKDFNLEYIFFGNPIWSKPLIKIDDQRYCWPIPGTFISFCIELMEKVILDNSRLEKVYRKRRTKFLENSVEKLFKNNFKTAKVYNNLIRLDEDGENDLLVILDSYAIIVESKSGKISEPARRGAPSRLKKEIDELIIQPSNQAKNFDEYIRRNLTITEFTNKNNEKILVDFSGIKHIIRLGVTFDLFGPLAARTPLLLESSLIENEIDVSPSIFLLDLSTLFEFLESDSEKIHYLVRRSQIDKTTDYNADELDLIAFYLQTGFNLGDVEFGEMPLQIYGLSQEVLDPYLLKKYQAPDENNIKPRLRLTEWWQEMLQFLEIRKTPGWTDLAIRLLNVPYENQEGFESQMNELGEIVDKEWKDPSHLNSVILVNGPEKRKELIIGYRYKNKSLDERNNKISLIVEELCEKEGFEQALVICLDVEEFSLPYSAIGTWGLKKEK